MFNRLAIATRLLIAFGAMGAILLVLAGVGLMGQRVAERDVATLKRQSGNAIQTERVARLFAQTRVLVNDALAGDDAAAWGRAETALAATREQQALLAGAIVNADRRAKAEAMATLTTRYQELLRQARAGGGDSAGALASARELAGRIDAEADQLTTAIRQSSARATADADAEMVAMGRWALAVAGGGVVLALLLTLRISRSVAQPLARMGEAMDAIAAGDVVAAVPCLDRHDAIGQMARAVEVFRRNAEQNHRLQTEQEEQRQHAEAAKHDALCVMAETVEGEADAAIDDIARLTGDMAEAVERLCQVALRTSQGASASAASAEQVLSSADAVAAATRQLHASIAEIGAQLEHTRTIARKAVSATQAAQEVMAGLTEATQRIGRVVGLISTVAGKTNLLALNATIEAARAGEAGKGFAVVAGEVKGLANQTEHATGEIDEQIQSILAVAEQALVVMGSITTTIAEVESGATAIATAIEEQSAATSEIARAVDHTSDASRHVASLMADMAEEARQSSELSDEVKKDGARVTETMAGFGRTIGRVIRTSTPEVDRRADRRYGVYVPTRVVLADGAREATLTNLSAAGLALQVAGATLAPGQTLRLDCPALPGAGGMTVLAVEGGTVHAAFADNFRLSDETVARVGQDGALALLEKAKADHQGFVAGVVAVLDGQSAAKAADLANHHTCRLGKWYDSVSDDRVLACPAFGALVEPHQRVHQAGKAALAAHWHGDAVAARAAAEDLRRASAEVVELLGRLAAEVRSGAASAVAA